MKNQGQPTARDLQMSLLNMRQMYEAAIQEKMMAQVESGNLRALVVGLIYPEETAVIQATSFEAIKSGEVQGIDLDGPDADGNVTVILQMGEPGEFETDEG